MKNLHKVKRDWTVLNAWLRCEPLRNTCKKGRSYNMISSCELFHWQLLEVDYYYYSDQPLKQIKLWRLAVPFVNFSSVTKKNKSSLPSEIILWRKDLLPAEKAGILRGNIFCLTSKSFHNVTHVHASWSTKKKLNSGTKAQ